MARLFVIFFVGQIFNIAFGYKIVSQYPTQFGESPHWDNDTLSLTYVDFFGEKYNLLRYDYREDKVYAAKIYPNYESAAFAIPIKGSPGYYAVGFKDRVVRMVKWDGKSKIARCVKNLFAVDQSSNFKDNLWHLAKADPYGRFYGGTMRIGLCSLNTQPYGKFYRYKENRGYIPVFNEQVGNGIEWSVKNKQMYHSDACNFALKSFNWNPSDGNITNGKEIFQIFKGAGRPTYTGFGLALNRNNNLLVGIYNGSAVWEVNPERATIEKIYKLSTEIVCDVAFGGPNLNKLFVTTSKISFDLFTGAPSNDTLSSSAGFLHILDIETPGYKANKLDLE